MPARSWGTLLGHSRSADRTDESAPSKRIACRPGGTAKHVQISFSSVVTGVSARTRPDSRPERRHLRALYGWAVSAGLLLPGIVLFDNRVASLRTPPVLE